MHLWPSVELPQATPAARVSRQRPLEEHDSLGLSALAKASVVFLCSKFNTGCQTAVSAGQR